MANDNMNDGGGESSRETSMPFEAADLLGAQTAMSREVDGNSQQPAPETPSPGAQKALASTNFQIWDSVHNRAVA